jgi:hypothetical protein
MSTADTPAVARHRVRTRLRGVREAKRFTQSQVAKAMEWSLTKVMSMADSLYRGHLSPALLQLTQFEWEVTVIRYRGSVVVLACRRSPHMRKRSLPTWEGACLMFLFKSLHLLPSRVRI